ncbi:unnamed protein product, partial [Laminaria digitata]
PRRGRSPRNPLSDRIASMAACRRPTARCSDRGNLVNLLAAWIGRRNSSSGRRFRTALTTPTTLTGKILFSPRFWRTLLPSLVVLGALFFFVPFLLRYRAQPLSSTVDAASDDGEAYRRWQACMIRCRTKKHTHRRLYTEHGFQQSRPARHGGAPPRPPLPLLPPPLVIRTGN